MLVRQERVAGQYDEMFEFWRCFGIEVRGHHSPKHQPPDSLRHPRFILVPRELKEGKCGPVQTMVEIFRGRYPIRAGISDGDFGYFERHPGNGTYGIWVAEEYEAPDTLAGKTNDVLTGTNIFTMTVIEGIIFHLFMTSRGQWHPDQEYYTYCTGSGKRSSFRRNSLACPAMNWPSRLEGAGVGELFVHFYSNSHNYKHYRPRRVWLAT